MLRSIRLKNFRSLRDTGNVELRPIVLLVGANSSGKSSFLRFFPLLKQTAWSTNSSSPLLWYLDNSDVDFGDFSNARFQNTDEQWIEISAQLSSVLGHDVEFSSRIIGGDDGRSYVQRFTLSCLDDSVSLEIGDEVATTLTLNGREFSSAEVRLLPRLGGPIIRVDGHGIRSHIQVELTKLLTDKLDGIVEAETAMLANVIRNYGDYGLPDHILASLRKHPATRPWRALIASIAEDSDLIREIKELLFLHRLENMLDGLWEAIREYARGVRYIGPFRRSPQRFYRRSELRIDEIDRDGSNLAMFLDSLGAADHEAFSAWLRQHFGFGVHTERRDAHVSVMVDTDSRRSFNVMDMGFGMSQLLPVVAQCWLSSGQLRSNQMSLFRDTNRSVLPGTAPTLIAVEQPELHLHPHHQAQLADVFHSTVHAMDQIGQPICLCIETHSEAMLYRFGELVESGMLKRKDISILLFEKRPGTDESTVRPIEFDAKGVLQDWPIGFFRG